MIVKQKPSIQYILHLVGQFFIHIAGITSRNQIALENAGCIGFHLPGIQDSSHHQIFFPFLAGNPYKPLFATVTVRVGLAYLLAHRPEGHMWVITPKFMGILYPQNLS